MKKIFNVLVCLVLVLLSSGQPKTVEAAIQRAIIMSPTADCFGWNVTVSTIPTGATIRVTQGSLVGSWTVNQKSVEITVQATWPTATLTKQIVVQRPICAPTATPIPPTATPVPPTATAVPPTATPIPPTSTAIPPTNIPTATVIPPTATALPPTPTATIPPGLPADVDQYQLTYNGGTGARNIPGYKVYQTFTAGRSGTMTQIDIGFFNKINGVGTLEVFFGAGNKGIKMYSTTVPVVCPSGACWINFPVSVPMIAGEIYTFQFTPGLNMPSTYGLQISDPGGYSRGVMVDVYPNGEVVTRFDLVFMTHVK